MLKEDVQALQQQAERILLGDSDNYDGADGARIISELCDALLDIM